jgi:hypothetical protein
MPLPKVKHPIYEFTVPSTGKKESFRPFLVREEKILLIAKTSEDPADSLRAVKQIVNNCAISESFDVDKLPIFDLEYLFLQLRAVSVSNIVQVSYRDNEDKKVYDFTIDLKEVKVQFPEKVEPVIKVTDTMGLMMKWPAASLLDDKQYFNAGDEAYYELILRCIDKIYDGDDLYNPADYSLKEIEEFLDDCGVETLDKIQNFMSAAPRLNYKLVYTNSSGKERVIELTSLTDFFMLR